MVTRNDVARYAGVSSAVVSYVVNGGPRPVAASTAARVREAIDILGYRPNVSARALKTGTTKLLGLVVSDSSNPFFAEFALQTDLAAADQGYAVLMTNSQGNPDTEQRLIEQLVGRGVDGLLVASAQAHPEWPPGLRRSTPVVWVDRFVPVPGWRSLGVGAADGARLVVDHLIVVHRHRRVGLLLGEESAYSPDQRRLGWEAALRRHRLPIGPIAHTEFTREGGYVGGGRLLDAADRPTAVFAASDLQAVGLLRAAHERALRVPEDVAVVSFDGTEESDYCWPPLTSARQRIPEMAQAAVQTLMDLSVDQPEHQLFPMDLIIRRSCGCPAVTDQPKQTSRKGRSRS